MIIAVHNDATGSDHTIIADDHLFGHADRRSITEGRIISYPQDRFIKNFARTDGGSSNNYIVPQEYFQMTSHDERYSIRQAQIPADFFAPRSKKRDRPKNADEPSQSLFYKMVQMIQGKVYRFNRWNIKGKNKLSKIIQERIKGIFLPFNF
jgi:hypothetical protein